MAELIEVPVTFYVSTGQLWIPFSVKWWTKTKYDRTTRICSFITNTLFWMPFIYFGYHLQDHSWHASRIDSKRITINKISINFENHFWYIDDMKVKHVERNPESESDNDSEDNTNSSHHLATPILCISCVLTSINL